MDNNEMALAKSLSETVNNFSEVMGRFLQPDPIDLAVEEGHKELIKKVVDSNPANLELINFLCGYKKLIKQQKRCKNIAEKAKNYLEDYAIPENIKEDWLEFFFDKAKLVSDENMQIIWAKLLADEANKPGSINPSLLHTISIIRYEQAELFCNVSRFALKDYKKDDVHLLMFISNNRTAYENSSITPSNLKELERLGLIECNFDNEYIFENKKHFISGNHLITVYGDPENENKIKAGNVTFTYDGKKLYDIIDPDYKKYRSDILNFTVKKFIKRNCMVKINDKIIG